MKFFNGIFHEGIFAPKRQNLAQTWHFWLIWARPCRFFRCPVGGSVGGCGARAVSRKTPIYFIILLKVEVIATIWMILHLVHPSRLLALKKPPAEHFYHHRSSFCRLKNKQRLFGITSNTSSWFIRRPGVHCCLQRGRVCAREVDRRSPSL